MCYRGRAAKAPQWLDLEPGSLHCGRGYDCRSLTNDRTDFFEDNCEVSADLASLKRHLKPLWNGGKEYFRFEMDVVILFGLTELQAYIAWKEDVRFHSLYFYLEAYLMKYKSHRERRNGAFHIL